MFIYLSSTDFTSMLKILYKTYFPLDSENECKKIFITLNNITELDFVDRYLCLSSSVVGNTCSVLNYRH